MPVSPLYIPAGNPGEISFVAVFEESAELKQPFKLPYNTLVALLEDGGLDNSPLYDLDGNIRYSQGKTGYILPRRVKIFYMKHGKICVILRSISIWNFTRGAMYIPHHRM